MEKRGEMTVDRRWLDDETKPSSLKVSTTSHIKRQGLFDNTPGFGPFNNAGSSARTLLQATALSKLKKTLPSLVRGNVDKLDKREPQSPFEIWGFSIRTSITLL